MTSQSEVWLYGSMARGDADPSSDIDVLVAGSLRESALDRLPYPRDHLSVVQYEWDELEHMAGYGSLFLHHVRLEGLPLVANVPSRLGTMLAGLPRYARASLELRSFTTVLDDVEDSLSRDHSPTFELAVIATSLRHACILGCYAIGRPTFGRRSALRVFLTHGGLGELVDDAQRLYEFRLYEDGRALAPYYATTSDARSWLTHTRRVITEVERVIET